MTQTNCIKNLLNIEDENIYFYDNEVKVMEKKGKKIKYIHAYLTYTPKDCPKCRCINEGFDDIIKWNFKRNCNVKLPKVSGYNFMLLLDKQRFYCKHCSKTFTANTTLVNPFKNISENSRLNIINDLMKKGDEKSISQNNNVSTNSTNRILSEICKDTMLKNGGILPKSMGIDEFKATKDTKSKMAFIIVDQDSKKIFDINSSRWSNDIENYFKRYSKKQRDSVKYITLDLYKPYYKLMHSLFRNAVLIPDRFHIVIQFRNALDRTRIDLCKNKNKDYGKLKKYWKLILKNENDLDDKNKFYSPNFRKEVTEQYIVTYLINTDTTLQATYKYYQGLLNSLKNKDKDKFTNIIHNISPSTSIYAKKANKTLIEMEKYILNAFDYDLSNGIVEGTNNVIKQIKRTAYGYRKFQHLKTRVMLIKGLYNPIKNA